MHAHRCERIRGNKLRSPCIVSAHFYRCTPRIGAPSAKYANGGETSLNALHSVRTSNRAYVRQTPEDEAWVNAHRKMLSFRVASSSLSSLWFRHRMWRSLAWR